MLIIHDEQEKDRRKNALQALKNQPSLNLADDDNVEPPSETKVGKVLSDLTTKRAILLMFSVMVTIPLFNYDTYWTDITSLDSGCNILMESY